MGIRYLLTLDTAVASTHVEMKLEFSHGLLKVREGSPSADSRVLWKRLLHGLRLRLGFGLRSNSLSGAGNNLTVDVGTLNQPVVAAVAGNAFVDTRLAQVKITILASRAMVVHIRSRGLAAVAANGEPGTLAEWEARLRVDKLLGRLDWLLLLLNLRRLRPGRLLLHSGGNEVSSTALEHTAELHIPSRLGRLGQDG